MTNQRRTNARRFIEQFAAQAQQDAMQSADQSLGEFFFGVSPGRRAQIGRDSALAGTAAETEMLMGLQEAQRQDQFVRDSAAGTQQAINNLRSLGAGQLGSEAVRGIGTNIANQVQAGISPADAAASVAGASEQGQAARYKDFVAANQGLIDTQQARFLQRVDGGIQVMDAYQQINGFIAAGDALGAQAALIKLAKILDPTSVVREGEVEVIRGGMGVGQGLQNAYNRLINEGFSESSRQAMLQTARSAAVPVLERTLQQRQEFGSSLNTVLGPDFPGLDRIVTGTGTDWGEMAEIVAGGIGVGKIDNGDGTTSKVVDFNDLPLGSSGPIQR